jgi:hypothetical protein
MNLWLELDNCLSVAQFVRVGLQVRFLPVGRYFRFSQLLAGTLYRSNKCIKIPLEISV